MKCQPSDVFWNQLQKLEGDEGCLAKLMPILVVLVDELVEIPCSQYGRAVLPVFKKSMLRINEVGASIETVERDSLLGVLYNLGELVGISRESYYLEEWRGDW